MKNEGPTHLDLFSGIGGFALAAKWAGFRTIGFCEIDKYCQKVLRLQQSRISPDTGAGSKAANAKNFLADTTSANGRGWAKSGRLSGITGTRSQAPIISDIRNLNGREFYGVDLITGGFPCQPFSVAGKRRGKEDDRHLWPEMLRVINEARPAWVLGENVAGIINMELDSVLSDLESAGYATRTFAIPACAVDARHRRMRVWIVAYDERARLERHGITGTPSRIEQVGQHTCATSSNAIASSDTILSERSDDTGNELRRAEQSKSCIRGSTNGRTESEPRCCEWELEPDVGRVAHGIPSRVDRLKGLGNAIVPQVAYQILREIRKLC